MQILKTSREFSKKEIYKLTRSPEIKKLSENIGIEIPVAGFVIFTDTDSNGNETELLSILANDGTVYATNSKTARQEMEYIADLMDGEEFTVEAINGVSKAGRQYVTLVLK